MNREILIQQIADNTGLSKKESHQAILGFMEAVTTALARGEKVQLVGFGRFSIAQRKKQRFKNPRTGQIAIVPARNVVKFHPGTSLGSVVEQESSRD